MLYSCLASANNGHGLSANGSTLVNPLTPEQLLAFTTANDRARKVRRVARVAGFNGWSIGGIALVSLPFAFFSFTTLVVTIALGVVAFNEFRGQRLLNRFEPTACRLLGWNQIGFLMLIIAYCAWSIFSAYHTPDPLAAYPELRELGDLQQTVGDLYLKLTLAVYGGVIFASLIFQGGNALYYFTRERLVREYLSDTEPWVIDLQKSAS